MYFKVEPTGCCERKGLVQVRYCFYLEEGEHNYDKHYVDVPILPVTKEVATLEEKEEVIEKMPTLEEDIAYTEWLKTLPTKKQLNPFHNHFVLFPNGVTDEEIQVKGTELLTESYKQWSEDKRPIIKNKPILGSEDKAVIDLCKARATSIKGELECQQ